MNLETVTIESLKLDPNNARKHSKRNLDAIAASVEIVRKDARCLSA